MDGERLRSCGQRDGRCTTQTYVGVYRYEVFRLDGPMEIWWLECGASCRSGCIYMLLIMPERPMIKMPWYQLADIWLL